LKTKRVDLIGPILAFSILEQRVRNAEMKKFLIGVAAAASFGPAAAFAVPLAVQNASFEQPSCQLVNQPGPCFKNSKGVKQ
jgi:hypothetical protein